MKKSLIKLAVSMIMLSQLLIPTLQTQAQTSSENNEETSVMEEGTEKVNSKIKEIQDTLMSQLEPLPQTEQGEKVGVLVISLTNPFWVNMKEKYEQAGEKLGINVEVFAAPTEGDTNSQLETLDGMTAKEYDAIILSPIDENNLIPGILRSNQAGIPIINLGPGVNKESLESQEGKLDGIITVDFVNQGKMVAEDMISRLPDGGKVAIIQGLAGAGQSEGRTQGAKEVFESTDGIELVSVQPGDWDRNKAYDITTNLVQANPDLKAIFACNDVMALAAVEALEEENMKDQVIVYGVDFTEEAHQSILDGKLDGSITYSPTIYTEAALLLALKITQGQEVNEPVYCPLTIVNQENINEFEGWQ